MIHQPLDYDLLHITVARADNSRREKWIDGVNKSSIQSLTCPKNNNDNDNNLFLNWSLRHLIISRHVTCLKEDVLFHKRLFVILFFCCSCISLEISFSWTPCQNVSIRCEFEYANRRKTINLEIKT